MSKHDNMFDVEVIFRKADNFVKHNTKADSQITAVITLYTDWCDLEPILASLNVDRYTVLGYNGNCYDDKMHKVPEFYFEPIE